MGVKFVPELLVVSHNVDDVPMGEDNLHLQCNCLQVLQLDKFFRVFYFLSIPQKQWG